MIEHSQSMVLHEMREKFMGVGDQVKIITYRGSKKTTILNRKTYDLDAQKVSPWNLLGGMGEVDSKLEINLIWCPLIQKNIYKCKSLDHHPFEINQTFSIEAFIKEGDVISFGSYVKMTFIKSQTSTQQKFNQVKNPLIPEKICQSDLPILITGETGVGKSRLAKSIHRESGRKGKFMALNLSALSENLLESHLFGHKKGAFTGAYCDHGGAIAEAAGGTLFLDEIDSLGLHLQVKILSLLEEKTYQEVGGRERMASCRFIFASGKKLELLEKQGKLRSDLFYRLSSGYSCELKPLREDPEKLTSFIAEFEKEHHVVMSPRLSDFYKTLSWPGNIRQFKAHLNLKLQMTSQSRLEFCQLDQQLLHNQLNLQAEAQHILQDLPDFQIFKKRYFHYLYLLHGKSLKKCTRHLKLHSLTVKKNLSDDVLQEVVN